jgi:hypothetical protein
MVAAKPVEWLVFVLWIAGASPVQTLAQQTQIPLSRQRAADFTMFPTTKPFKMGVALPSTCGTGEMFFNSAAAAGQNVYACYAPDLWSLVGSSSGAVSPETGVPGYFMTNGTTASWGNISTGGSGALDCATTPAVCDIVSPLVPLKTSANAWAGANDFSSASFLRLPIGVGVPNSGCALSTDAGKVYIRNDAETPSASFYICSQTGNGIYSWELGQATGASALPVYNASGVLVPASHIVSGLMTLVSGAAAISLSGAAAFTNSTSYECTANDLMNAVAVLVSQASGSAITFSIQGGGPNDSFTYICVGN